MLTLLTKIVERTEHTVTVSVDLTNYHNQPESNEFYVVTLDRITDRATVYHAGRSINTQHNLGYDVAEEDVEAFAICAVVSLAFNIKG
ncbi:MAG: hypothetical protein ACKOX6_00790 [Bdellovibrio sp.]